MSSSRFRLPYILGILVFGLLVVFGYTNLSPAQTATGPIAYRGSIFHLLDDPAKSKDAYQYIEDGLLVVENGKVKQVGEASDLISKFNASQIVDHSGKLIMPGFVDTHIHYPQTEMVASYGEQLLEWLNTYTFPTEKQFADKNYSKGVAKVFLNQLLKNGTTTALVFGTVHKGSVDALFEEAKARNLRLIAGKVMMDRNAPDYLRDTPESSYRDSKELIDRWHKNGRLLYAVTPRFAPTSTPEQLNMAQKLLKEYPDVYMHTHLSENKGEVAWVKSLFPKSDSYLGVYNDFGLSRNRSIYAHSIHLSDQEFQSLAKTGSGIAFCPTSNLFLGSGLFDLKRADQYGVRVGMGTDIGAGTSFSMLQTMNEAYKVIQMHKAFSDDPKAEKSLTPFRAYYLSTLGGTRALYLDDKIGNFLPGKEADFVVLNPKSTDLLAFRMSKAKTLDEKLFVLQMLGDDRAVEQTYIMGKRWHESKAT